MRMRNVWNEEWRMNWVKQYTNEVKEINEELNEEGEGNECMKGWTINECMRHDEWNLQKDYW